MGARPPPPPSPLPSARCRERGAREAPVTAARASAASSAVRGGGGRRGPGTARRQPRRGWLGDCCGDDAGEWEGVEFASPPPRPGAALPGGGTPCLFLRGRWRRRRRMERAPPPSSPPVPRPAGAEGDGAAETPSVSPPGVGPPVTVVPGFWGGDGTTDTTYSPSSPQRGAAAPLAGRAALGVAPAVTGRGPRPPLPRLCPRVCLTGLLPRPPPGALLSPRQFRLGAAGSAGFAVRVSAGGTIGCWPPRPDVRRGWVFCVCVSGYAGGGVGVCMFVCFGFALPRTDSSPPGCGEGLSSPGAGGSGPWAGCQESAGGSFISASPPLREGWSPSWVSAAASVKPSLVYRR